MATSALTNSISVWKYHIFALVTALIWSTTFVSTKVLILSGMTPETIFITRFAIAYILLVCFSHRRLFADSLKDEFMLFLAGLTGGTLYFLTENTAISLTYTTNVSIIISATPLITILLTAAIFHQKLSVPMIMGSAVAFVGVCLVIFNGDAAIHVSPLGDLLTLAAALCWAFYSIILKYIGSERYSISFITRKIFFYGLVGMLLYFPFCGQSFDFAILLEPKVASNILFLSVIASFACFLIWNKVVDVLGPDKANNYIYLSPLGTIVTAVIVLHEPLSWMAIAGAAITIAGVIIVEKSHN